MSPTKINRLLNEALEKYGNINIVELIDYYWRETYEGSCNWKVREKITLQNIIDSKPDSTYHIGNLFGIRDILKYLESEEKTINYLPYKISIEYEDSKQRWEDMKKVHPKEEADKKAMFNYGLGILYNREAMEFVNKIYNF